METGMKKLLPALFLACFLSVPVMAEEITITDGSWTCDVFNSTISKEITVKPAGDYILLDDVNFYVRPVIVKDGCGTLSYCQVIGTQKNMIKGKKT